MDITTLGAAIAIAKCLPDTAAGRAESAATRAETAAEAAEAHAFGVTVTNSVLNFTLQEG